MTRFARSRGSKGSNERVPEDSTPWYIMKKQAESLAGKEHEHELREKAEQMRKQNYENFLKEEEAKKAVTSWCEFEDVQSNDPPEPVKLEKSKKKQKVQTEKSSTDKESNDSQDASKPKKAKKNQKVKKDNKSDVIESNNHEYDFDENDPELVKWCKEGDSDPDTKNKYKEIKTQLKSVLSGEKMPDKPKKKKKNKNSNKSNDFEVQSIETDVSKNVIKPSNDTVPKMSKNQKKKLKKQAIKTAQSTETPEVRVENNDQDIFVQKNNNKKRKLEESENQTENTVQTSEEPSNKKKAKKDKRPSENRTDESFNKNKNANDRNNFNDAKNKQNKNDSQPYARRKPFEVERSKIYVNGEEHEVMIYDGFPILSKDGERLIQLRKNLISKGIAKSEVNRTMKLERRKCEKALSRIKKKMCFHCRKGGHNLAECPELSNQSNTIAMPSSGICFKCGSTEHTHFACKVVKSQEYKFAQCFICNEQGHISRQCPDNPKGLYPRGGGCRECGDVTHLKKDCPKIIQSKENDTIRLETLGSGDVEAIEAKSTIDNKSAKSVKHIRF